MQQKIQKMTLGASTSKIGSEDIMKKIEQKMSILASSFFLSPQCA
jgi:hypothetical protein